jgi:D-3-phosphoglycerate dehydrogenase
MAKFKVVITDREFETIDPEREVLEKIGAEVFAYQFKDEDDVIRIAKDCDGLIMQYANLTRKVIESLEKCKVISKYAIGLDRIDLKAATEKDICVGHVAEYCVDEVSTHTIALILALSRKILLHDKNIKNGIWDYKLGKKIFNLRGQTIGLVGFGKIARVVMEKIKPYGMNILVYDPFVPAKAVSDMGGKLVDFDDLIRNSDYVSIHVPLLESTKYMFNKEVFQKMKNSAILINMGRGPVIKETDLIWALQNKEIAAAGLDVTDPEPIEAGNPMLKMDNVIITPHAAYYSEESQKALQTLTAENVAQVLTGYYPRYLANREIKETVKLRELPE